MDSLELWWVLIPDWLLAFIIICILMVIVGSVILLFIPKFLSLITTILQGLGYLFAYFFYYLSLLLIKYKYNHIVHLIERMVSKTLLRLDVWRRSVFKYKIPIGIKKKYKKYSFITSVIIAAMVGIWQGGPIEERWTAFDEWIYSKQFKGEITTSEAAWNQLFGKVDGEGSVYRLAESFEAGNLRAEPVADLSNDNVILAISHQDEIEMVGDTKQIGDRLWVKVLVNGEIGWVSERILTKVSP